MSKVNQKEAVFQAVINVCGEQDGAYTPTKEQRTQVNMILVEGFKSGTIELDKTYDESGLKSYCSGLQSNWLRKDKRLNGGVKYEAKAPGSRAGSGDASVKAMRALLATKTDANDRAEIQSFIDSRLAEIKPNSPKTLTPEQIAVLETMGLGHFVK